MKLLPISFIPRLISTVTLWTIIAIVVVVQSENGYALLIAAAALGSLWEYFWLLKVARIPRHWSLGYAAGVILMVGNFWLLRTTSTKNVFYLKEASVFVFESILLAVVLITLFTKTLFSSRPHRKAADAIAFTLLGIIYIPWLFSFIAKIIYLTPRTNTGMLTGQYYVLFLLVVTKFTDVGAFVCGSLFGKRPFFAHISSQKTQEGCLGALFCGVLSGWIFFSCFRHELPLLNSALALVISLILGIAAIAGDLAESILKRMLQIKNSSNTLPGIGGGLDLIDSVLFTAPIFYFMLQGILWSK